MPPLRRLYVCLSRLSEQVPGSPGGAAAVQRHALTCDQPCPDYFDDKMCYMDPCVACELGLMEKPKQKIGGCEHEFFQDNSSAATLSKTILEESINL